ncbi:hypothetical protein INT43_004389 [Umbelopsis isabellina]|uniref:Uncharacterized protein n=1 Tax=Mortierella isabellina TaxID=91625 RepID=A0A8H7U7L4_MORIS|nr:hypothetical protein INT43_004389 [Umbelopsis isabellina]
MSSPKPESITNHSSQADGETHISQAQEPITAIESDNGSQWATSFQMFFRSIGFTETYNAFEDELITLSDDYSKRLPQYISQLLTNLLPIIENDNNAVDSASTNEIFSAINSSESAKRKRSEGEEEREDSKLEKKIKKMNPDQIQIRATNEELRNRIEKFIQAKKSEVDASNRTEFLQRKESGENEGCARTDAREIDRNIQMKFDIVNNEDGPLQRSLVTSASHVKVGSTIRKESGADERLQNLEDHLNIRYGNNSKNDVSLFERIKVIEDTIVQIEKQNPLWAAVHFNQPNRVFPPPPVVHLITPLETTSQNPAEQKSYTSSAIVPTSPQPLKPTGRANSSLTRAVIEQLARKQNQFE